MFRHEVKRVISQLPAVGTKDLDAPHNHASSPLTPTSSTDRSTTVRPDLDAIPPDLAQLASQHNCEAILERLHVLCLRSNDKRFVGAHISFISRSESVQTLSDWADDHPVAKALEPLARAAWSAHLLVAKLQPVRSTQRASRVLHGDLGDQYLAGMLSARRPVLVKEPAAAIDFIQRLRALVLIRAIEAGELGAIRERHLETVCDVLRMACDIPGNDKVAWILRLRCHDVDLDAFAQTLETHCAMAKGEDAWEPGAKGFFRAMQRIAAGGPWRPMEGGAAPVSPAQSALPEDQSRKVQGGHFFGATTASEAFDIATDSADTLLLQPCASDPAHPPYRNTKRGEGLILESVQKFQYLRHSWHHFSVAEEVAFEARIERLLKSDQPVDRAGAAIVLVASVTGRTMGDVTSIRFGADLSADWTLDATRAQLHRQPARFGRGWKSADHPKATPRWLHAQATRWTIQLASAPAYALRELSAEAGLTDLAQAWSNLSPGITIQDWFNNRFTALPELSRLTSPCTSTLLEQQTFEFSKDQSLARLIGSQERTALPAACAYGAYRSPVVRSAFTTSALSNLYEVVAPTSSDDLNACGSELDVLLSEVAKTVHGLALRTSTAAEKPEDWAQHHNLLTSLTVLCLLVSTGARPVNSPFETLYWFDLERGLVYVEDKASGPTRGARVCILTRTARDLLIHHYLPHLARLASRLVGAAPTFAAEIGRVLNRDRNAKLPLFFYVKAEPDFDWLEVSESQLGIESQIDWPLPWNLFRHIHATELVRRGVHPEIVDALLSHGDRGAESHGPHSLRVPASDLAHARPAVEALQDELGFTAAHARLLTSTAATRITLPSSDAPLFHPFGIQARKERREARREVAEARALSDINALIDGKPLDSLSTDNWQAIARRMLFRKDDVPHPSASLRYEVFEKFVDRLWQEKRALSRLTRKYTVLPEMDAIFNESFIEADRRLAALRKDFELQANTLASRELSPSLAAAMAVVDLILTSRVAHRGVVKSLLQRAKVLKLVRAQRKLWLEWCDAETWRDGRPMLRVSISMRTARWVETALGTPLRGQVGSRIPKELAFLAQPGSHASTLHATILEIVRLQDQSNKWNVPGTDAAYLNGTSMFPALPHDDWIRVATQQARVRSRDCEDESDEPTPTVEVDDIYYMPHHRLADNIEETPSATSCAQLIQRISSHIDAEGAQVQTCRAEIERELKAARLKRGSALYVLGHFVLHLLTRKSKQSSSEDVKAGVAEKRGRDGLRLTTVRRYLKSLAPPLTDLAHDIDLRDLDEEELTDLYSSLVEWWSDHFAKQGTVVGSSDKDLRATRLTAEERSVDAANRTLRQLRHFHEFAGIVYSLDEPDWTMISAGKVGAIGRPGLVTLREYRWARDALIAERSIKELPEEVLAQIFVLFCGARFGLRLGEAVGMLLSDIVQIGDALVLLVRPNRVRPLKTAHSRRQVPLCEPIDPVEADLISELRGRWTMRNKPDQDAPLIAGLDRSTFKSMRSSIGSVLREILKAATCNPHTTQHFLRHSFATRILALLRGIALGPGEPIDGAQVVHVRRLLLGSDEVDRRTLWAVARLLGHSTPSVTARCYLHGLEGWLEGAAPDNSEQIEFQLGNGIIDLDASEFDENYGSIVAPARPPERLVESQILALTHHCRLLALGRNFDVARTTSGAQRALAAALQKRIESMLGRHGEGQASKESPDAEPLTRLGVFSAIPIRRWDAMVGILDGKHVPAEQMKALNVLETVGRRRQIVLFLDEHYQALAAFISDLGLAPNDICLIASRGAIDPTATRLSSPKLSPFVVTAESLGTKFQLDTATYGPMQMRVQHRSVMITNPSATSRIDSTYELLFLWIVWNLCSAIKTD